jgi:hypothetical protein
VNPEHLFLGTARENRIDAKVKGRLPTGDQHWRRRTPEKGARGEFSGNAKLGNEDVLNIRTLAAEGFRHVEIADAFCVNLSTIDRIVAKRSWSHL